MAAKDKLYSSFLHLFLTSAYKIIRNYGEGGNQAALNCELVRSFKILIPPIREQKEIADYIETETARIDAKIAKTKRIIELQKEYRTALISEAVTGKIKVPELAT